MHNTQNLTHFYRLTAAALLLGWSLLAASCGDSGRPGLASWQGSGVGHKKTITTCAPGATRECGVTLGEYAGVLSCYMGTQACAEGVWLPCGDGRIASVAPPTGGRQLLALGSAQDCEDNPCDPGCQYYDEDPNAALVAEQGDPIFVWTGGSLGDFPRGLVNKGLVEPCSTAVDCQFNHRCDGPITGSECSHSMCQEGVGLEPTCGSSPASSSDCVGLICGANPECCAAEYTGSCSHSPCSAGDALKSTCDTCVSDVCSQHPECCSSNDGKTGKKGKKGSSTPTTLDPDAPLASEAEHATSNTPQGSHTWTEVNESDASNGVAMQALPDSGTNNNKNYESQSPRLDFPFYFVEAGTWYVWIHGKAVANQQGNSDSVHVGLDGSGQKSADRITRFSGNYAWSSRTMDGGSRAELKVSKAGQHIVNVWMREDGFSFDKIVLTRDENYEPSGFGPAENGTVGSEAWTSECASLYASSCGADVCEAGNWTDQCVSMVKSVCGAECSEQPAATCSHGVCETGSALDGGCHPCVSEICKKDPSCCLSGWDATCVQRVETTCGLTCPVEMSLPPPEAGQCVPRLPGEIDASCGNPNLAVGVPCEGKVPVCNHGAQTAPSGVRIIHYPANSQQYPRTSPDQSHPQMYECFTKEAIAPGHCTTVEDCPKMTGNRAIMVNPPGPAHVDECRGDDNWSLASNTDVSCQPPVCSESDTTAYFRDVHLIFVMDKSGSMKSNNKWQGSSKALKSFFGAEESAGLHVAMEFYPLDDHRKAHGDGCGHRSVGECSADPCSNPMVPEGELLAESGAGDQQEQALSAAVDSLWPGGGTPTYPALDGALRWAAAGINSNPNDVYAVVLVTDGEPTKCETSTGELSKLALNGYLTHGVRTYTIGMEGANLKAMDSIAHAGGTGSAFVVGSGAAVEQDLLDALQSISGDVARCQFEVANGEYLNPDDATVTYTPSSSGSPVDLPRVANKDDCGTGWYFDDPDQPGTATLCPDTCATVQADSGARVDVRIGCATPLEETQVLHVYEGRCPTSMVGQWGYLSWEAEVVGDSSIVFDVRTAPTESTLATADWQAVATATESRPSCTVSEGGDDCPIALYPALDGVPSARNPWLELRATLKPTSGGSAGPSLHNWELSFSCVDNE